MVMRSFKWHRPAYVNTAVQHQALAVTNALRLLHNMHGDLNLHVAFLMRAESHSSVTTRSRGVVKEL